MNQSVSGGGVVRRAEDDLELGGLDAPLRRRLHVRRRRPRVRAPRLERLRLPRRHAPPPAGAVAGAVRGEVHGAPERRAQPPLLEPVRRHHHRQVDAVDQAHAVLRQLAHPVHAHLRHRHRRRVAGVAPDGAGGVASAAGARHDAPGPRPRREREGGEAVAVAVEAGGRAGGVGDGGEAGVGGDERPDGVGAEVVEGEVGGCGRRRSRRRGEGGEHGEGQSHYHLLLAALGHGYYLTSLAP